MDLSPGTRLASYEIVAPLGAGSMGDVYKARDIALGREVALKLLPEAFVSDEERLARFDREARLLAQLNHPGIAAIHRIETSDTGRFIVMELVPGGTLTRCMANGPLPWKEALKLACQMADALEAAHESGVVHRDLKPDNVGVTDDDTVKLLDFGIGKPVGEEAERAVGTSSGMTQTGTVLGTPAYVSPEQMRGKPVDRRADIWAFGCLLYEMLAGSRAFPGDTVGEIAAAVLTSEPDWAALPAGTPERLVRLMRDCLERDPRNRLRDMGEARRSIERMLAGDVGIATQVTAGAPASSPAAGSTQSRLRWPIALALAAMALAFMAGRMRGPDGATSESKPSALTGLGEIHVQVPIPPGHEMRQVTVSEDGSTVALVLTDSRTERSTVWIRRLNDTSLYAIPATAGLRLLGGIGLSPRGDFVAFNRDGWLRTCPTAPESRESNELCRQLNPRGGLSWGTNGKILFVDYYEEPLSQVPADGGESHFVTKPDEEEGENRHRNPTWLAGGPDFLAQVSYVVPLDRETPLRPAHLFLFRAAEGAHIPVCPSDSAGWVLGDWLLCQRGTSLWAQRFDSLTGSVSGKPEAVAHALHWEGSASASPAGVIAFQDGFPDDWGRELLWIEATANVDASGDDVPALGQPDEYWDASPSPVDDRVAVVITDKETRKADLWILGGPGGLERLTTRESGISPVWSPDGTKIAYAAHAGGEQRPTIYWRTSDCLGERHKITEGVCAYDWSPNGEWLSYQKTGAGGVCFYWVGDIEEGVESRVPKPAERILDTGEQANMAMFSPDGQWFAYQVGKGAQVAAYVRPFIDGWGSRTRITKGRVEFVDWSPTEQESGYEVVFQRERNVCIRVRLEPKDSSGAVWEQAEPEELFTVRQHSWNSGFRYHRDGKRILVTRKPKPNMTPVTVIVGWQPPEK